MNWIKEKYEAIKGWLREDYEINIKAKPLELALFGAILVLFIIF